MQKICIAAKGMSQVLDKASLLDGPPLDDRLEEWFSTDELSMCFNTLDQMRKMLQPDDTWMNANRGFVKLSLSSSEDKIDAAFRLFQSQKSYFYFLLTTDVWNPERPRHQSQANLVHAQDEPADELMSESNNGRPTEIKKSILVREDEFPKERTADDHARKLDNVLRWLDGLSCAVKQKETLELQQPGTCMWLISTPEYKAWRSHDDSFLWLQGKPGSGKTVLTSFVVNALNGKQLGEEVLAFFYCDFRSDRFTSAAEVMRSLLSQLLRHLYSGVIDSRDLLDDLARGRDSDTPVLKNTKQIAAFVSKTARKFDHQPLIVIDALDECKDVEKLLEGLLILAKGGMRLFVTSRPLQIIKDGLRGLPFISMDNMADALLSDISLHVTRELDSRRRLRDLERDLKMEIRSVLCDRADGMFRWVQCQIDTLNQCATRAEIWKALNNLPIGLDETYERILAAIDPESPEGKLASRVLVWLVGALRPLRLLEIIDGILVDVQKQIMDLDVAPLHKGALLDACSSLVAYNEDTGILILSHFSVKEYLAGSLAQSRLPRYQISYQSAHKHLARVCICYISLYLEHIHQQQTTPLSRIMHMINGQFQDGIRQRSHSSDSRSAMLSPWELLDYVLAEGFNHLAYLGSASHIVLKDMATLQSNVYRYCDSWEVVRRMSNVQVPWPYIKHDFIPYILTAFASDSLLRVFLGPDRKVLKPRHQTNPLIYAAHFGKVQHAQLLLSHGARVNEKGLVVDASREQIPLEVAVSRQHDAMVDLLLSCGSIVPSRLFALTTNNNFPVRIAKSLLQTAEFVEWAAEHGNRLPSPVGLLDRRPPLVYEKDIIVMIRRLLQVGLDPVARNSAQKTALHLAISEGYLATAVYLIFIGADEGENTAVHLAIETLGQSKCLEAVKILLDAGCKLYNKADKTPLHLAIEKGYFSVAEFLMLRQSPPLLDVLLAVVEGKSPIAQKIKSANFLINGGANIHGVTVHGDGLLHRAVMSLNDRESLEMVKFLIITGCNPFQRNGAGKLSLHIALDRKLPLVTEYLLSTGRPLPLDALSAIVCSRFPADWKAQKIIPLLNQGPGISQFFNRNTLAVPLAGVKRGSDVIDVLTGLPPGTLSAMMRCPLPVDWRASIICSLADHRADMSEISADGGTLLHIAASSLDDIPCLEVAKHLTGERVGCDPFVRNTNGNTPLQIALYRRLPLVTDYLLSTRRHLPPGTLFAVVRSALPEEWRARTICSFIDRGADVSELSADGSTLLHVTLVELRSLDSVVEHLISAGCGPFIPNKAGKTSLDIALMAGKYPIADYMLSAAKPSPDVLFSVLTSNCSPEWLVQKFSSFIDKVGIHNTAANGDTLIHTMMASRPESVSLPLLKLLVGCGCNLSARNGEGKTALHIAVEKCQVTVMEYILKLDQSLPDDILFSVFRSARPRIWDFRKSRNSSGQITMFRALVDKGANIHAVLDGNTLLHAVMSSSSLLWGDETRSIIGTLVERGCNVLAPNSSGHTSIHAAVAKSVSTVECLMNFVTPAHLPANVLAYALRQMATRKSWRYVYEMLQLLVRNGARVRVRHVADGKSLLHMAIKEHRDPASRSLRGSTISQEVFSFKKDFNIYPGLYLAKGESTKHTYILTVIKFLVESGCDPSQCDADGCTPIYFAALAGETEVVKYLLRRTFPSPQNLPDRTNLPIWDSEPEEVVGKWEICS